MGLLRGYFGSGMKLWQRFLLNQRLRNAMDTESPVQVSCAVSPLGWPPRVPAAACHMPSWPLGYVTGHAFSGSSPCGTLVCSAGWSWWCPGCGSSVSHGGSGLSSSYLGLAAAISGFSLRRCACALCGVGWGSWAGKYIHVVRNRTVYALSWFVIIFFLDLNFYRRSSV